MYELTLNDFEYEISNNCLKISKIYYNGEDEIEILPKYEIDGTVYKVKELLAGSFSKKYFSLISLPYTIECINGIPFWASSMGNVIYLKKEKSDPEYSLSEHKLLENNNENNILHYNNLNNIDIKENKI